MQTSTHTPPTNALARPEPRRGLARRLSSEIGQGTVEYVGLLLLMATILAGIVGVAGELGGKDQIGKKVVNTIGKSIDETQQSKR